MALYIECRINKKRTPADCFFGDFAHWERYGVVFYLICLNDYDISDLKNKRVNFSS